MLRFMFCLIVGTSHAAIAAGGHLVIITQSSSSLSSPQPSYPYRPSWFSICWRLNGDSRFRTNKMGTMLKALSPFVCQREQRFENVQDHSRYANKYPTSQSLFVRHKEDHEIGILTHAIGRSWFLVREAVWFLIHRKWNKECQCLSRFVLFVLVRCLYINKLFSSSTNS